MSKKKDVIFLDRDGVINVYPGDRNYVTSKDEFFFINGAIEGIKMLKDQGCSIYVISNQAGVSKGIYSQKQLDEITALMKKELKKNGVALDGIFYCTHQDSDQCDCRKPKTGLLDHATRSSIPDHCFFIGDSYIDVQTGNNFGCTTVLVLSGKETDSSVVAQWDIQPDYIFANLKEAAEFIIGSFVR